MLRKKIKVQADASYIDRIDELAEKLEEAGMTIRDKFAMIGHFRGEADADKIANLETIPGIATVTVIGNEGDEEADDYSISN